MANTSRLQQAARLAESRLARLYADARRRLRGGSSDVTPEGLSAADRLDLDLWVQRTAEAQNAFRAAVAPADVRVAVICSSHRPQDLETVIASMSCQTHTDLELVFVAHGDVWQMDDIESRLHSLDRQLARVQVISAPAAASLGACLNAGIDRTDARFIAKFDGDDRYGPNYVSDSLRAHQLADAGIVGKHTYYAHLEATDSYLLRFPGHEFEYTSTMSGGTFVIDRDVLDDQRFADLSLGEDRDFIRRCHRRGISTFSGDRFNYTVVRSDANTWMIDEAQFVAGSIRYQADWDPTEIDR